MTQTHLTEKQSGYSINFAFTFKREGQLVTAGTGYPISVKELLFKDTQVENVSCVNKVIPTIEEALWEIIYGVIPIEPIDGDAYHSSANIRKDSIVASLEALEKITIAIGAGNKILHAEEYDAKDQKVNIKDIDKSILEIVKNLLTDIEYEIQYTYYINNAVINENSSEDENYSAVVACEKAFRHEDGRYFTTSADTRLTKVLIGDILGETESVEGDALYETQIIRIKDVLNRVYGVRAKIYNRLNSLLHDVYYSIGEDVDHLVDVDTKINELLNRNND